MCGRDYIACRIADRLGRAESLLLVLDFLLVAVSFLASASPPTDTSFNPTNAIDSTAVYVNSSGSSTASGKLTKKHRLVEFTTSESLAIRRCQTVQLVLQFSTKKCLKRLTSFENF